MKSQLKVYNTLTRQKEVFKPLHPPRVGMYVCGPTVYGKAHLGHARSAITFDVVFRYLKYLGYQVRYVRNITDVGHLERDADEGEDKIAKQARLEQLEPMEVVRYYTDSYRKDMARLNVLQPSIEPSASGHIIEQIGMIEQIMRAGLAYEVNGSVYFDVEKYNKQGHYGKLSGRMIADLLTGTRALAKQQEKRGPLDFALWKKATPTHIMRWPSPWGEGFPGWHLECSAIGAKYLGQPFDIHGGGIDLLFPHHECEIAQSQVVYHTVPAKYWLHNNLITIDGQKMGKSLGNFITLEQLFQGTHNLLDQAYSPMVLRFFMLQAHYRGTLAFSIEALEAAKRGYLKLINGLRALKKLVYTEDTPTNVDEKVVEQLHRNCDACHDAMNDDFNTAKTIAQLFDLLKRINDLKHGNLEATTLGKEAFERLKNTYKIFVEEILGIKEEPRLSPEALLHTLLKLYREAKEQKQYDRVDAIRAALKGQGIILQDMKTGVDWTYEV
ncbi:MAG: cysteine--tRNA ligase [Cytophagales bacterium]|nr:cysteine--tRNA ligase [Cytophagales bacterium]